MKLKEFLEGINAMVAKDPSILDLEVITSKDSEGNGYNEVYCGPETGHYSEDDEFIPRSSEDYENEWELTDKDINVICIN